MIQVPTPINIEPGLSCMFASVYRIIQSDYLIARPYLFAQSGRNGEWSVALLYSPFGAGSEETSPDFRIGTPY